MISETVWGGEGVTDANLTQHIYLLRLLLGERKSERKYIVTVPGGGYRFAETVREAPEGEDEFIEGASRSGEQFIEEDIDVFHWYCHGSYLLDRRTALSLRQATSAFENALALNPNHFPSLIGLARANALLAEYWHVEPQKTFPTARAAVERALHSDPHSSMAHAALSEILLFGDWDWVGAKKEIVAAIALNPQSPFARNNAAWLNLLKGDFEKALFEARQALIIEPASLQLRLLLGRIFIHSKRYDVAIANLRNIISSDPAFYLARRYLAVALLLDGQPEAAIREVESAEMDRAEDTAFRLPLLGRALADRGELEEASDIYDALRERAESEFVTSWNLAMVAYGLGRLDDTIEYLRTGVRNREPAMLFLRTIPWFRHLEVRPEFNRMLREIGP